MDVIITGSTGGIGGPLVSQLLPDDHIDRIYCQFRDRKKFIGMYGETDPKVMMEERTGDPSKDTEHLICDLRQNGPADVACIFTAFSISPIKRIGGLPKERLLENLYINLVDPIMLSDALMRYKKRYGVRLRFINFDSGAAYRPLEGWSLYSASKAYMNMFLKTLRLEDPDIRVVSYEPGVVDTPMQAEIRRTEREEFGDVDLFKTYHKDGILKDPSIIAKDVIDRFILDWDTDSFHADHKKR